MSKNSNFRRRSTESPRKSREKLPQSTKNQAASSPILEFISKHRKGVGAACILTLGGMGAVAMGPSMSTKSQQIAVSPEKSPESGSFKYTVDGCEVESATVSQEKFQAAYQKAMAVTGGLYWHPKKLSVEYGDVAKDHFAGSYLAEEEGSKASWTSKEMDRIIANPEHLPHELVHFLMGPEAYKWTPILQEVISGAADVPEAQYRYSDLNQPWIQMPVEQSMYSGSPITNPRYAALQSVGRRYKDKMPMIIRSAMKRNDLNFDNLAAFLKGFGIEHKILEKGASGKYQAFVPYADAEKSGYLFVRYERVAGQADEFGWVGKIKIAFTDNQGLIYDRQQLIPVSGMVFVEEPPKSDPSVKFVAIKVLDGMGEYNQSLE